MDPEETSRLIEALGEFSGSEALGVLRAKLAGRKPNDRSDLDRRYQIVLAEIERAEGLAAAWGI